MTRENQRSRSILIVEDNPVDYEALQRVFSGTGLEHPIEWCENGQEALDYVFRRGVYAGRSHDLPGTILLDLELPEVGGREVLRELKSHPEIKKVPVIVLATSADERDVDDAYKAGANSYLLKSRVADDPESITRLLEFWLETVILPSAETTT